MLGSAMESTFDLQRLEEVITSQFACGVDSVHGPSHWRRVLQNGIWIARRSGADPMVVTLFAWFHDSKRVNDMSDPGHGRRGAEFAKLLRGEYFQLPDDAFELLVEACTWHTDRDFSDDPTVGTCWDADRMDLGRVGITPSARFMSTDFGRAAAEAGSFSSLLEESERSEAFGSWGVS